jgi:hypothetical protein
MLTMLGQMYCWEVIIFYTPSQSRVFFGKKKEEEEKRRTVLFVCGNLYHLILTVSDETLAWKRSY